MITCDICQRTFKSIYALNAHSFYHDKEKAKAKSEKVSKTNLILNNINRKKREQLYNENPKVCLHCQAPISYNKRNSNKYCSHSCSATACNSKRLKLSKPKRPPRKVKVMQDFVCPVCSKVMSIPQSVAKKKKFCSGTCRNKINNLKMKGSRSKAEVMLEEAIRKEFSHWNVIFNSRDILGGLELDVYIPHLSLGIEWNGIFHFEQIHKNDCLSKVQRNDSIKKDRCKELGISLIVICDRTSRTSFIIETIDNLIKMLKELDTI